MSEDKIAKLTEEIEKDPNNARKYRVRGWVYWGMEGIENKKKGVQDASKSLELDPYEKETWRLRGQLKSDLKLHDEAIQDLKKAVAMDPNYSFGWNALGRCYKLGLSDFKHAIESYLTACEVNEKDEFPRNNLGIVLKELGKYQKSIEYYDESLSIRPNYKSPQTGKKSAVKLLETAMKVREPYIQAISKLESKLRLWLQQRPDIILKEKQTVLDYVKLYFDELKDYFTGKVYFGETKVFVRKKLVPHGFGFVLEENSEKGWKVTYYGYFKKGKAIQTDPSIFEVKRELEFRISHLEEDNKTLKKSLDLSLEQNKKNTQKIDELLEIIKRREDDSKAKIEVLEKRYDGHVLEHHTKKYKFAGLFFYPEMTNSTCFVGNSYEMELKFQCAANAHEPVDLKDAKIDWNDKELKPNDYWPQSLKFQIKFEEEGVQEFKVAFMNVKHSFKILVGSTKICNEKCEIFLSSETNEFKIGETLISYLCLKNENGTPLQPSIIPIEDANFKILFGGRKVRGVSGETDLEEDVYSDGMFEIAEIKIDEKTFSSGEYEIVILTDEGKWKKKFTVL